MITAHFTVGIVYFKAVTIHFKVVTTHFKMVTGHFTAFIVHFKMVSGQALIIQLNPNTTVMLFEDVFHLRSLAKDVFTSINQNNL